MVRYIHKELIMPFMERLQSAMILKTPMHHPLESHIIEHPHKQFYDAIRTGNNDDVIALIEEGFDVDHNECAHTPPLQYAILKEQHYILQTLLLYGADVNICNFKGESPLHSAVKLQQMEAVHLLLRYGANPSIPDHQGLTALVLARQLPTQHIYKALKSTPAMPIEELGVFDAVKSGNLHALTRSISTKEELFTKNDLHQNLLHLAVISGNTKMVVYLLNKGIDIDAPDENGDTPLTLCALYQERNELLSYLLERHATLDHKNNFGSSALTISLRYGHIEHARTLIESGANIHTFEKLDTPLTLIHKAIEKFPAHADAFRTLQRELLIKGASVDVLTNHLGWTPLIQTTTHRQDSDMQEHLELLINLGAEVNLTDKNGRTPLMLAASMGRNRAVKTLLDNYADPNMSDYYGWSALMLCTYYNHSTIATTLLKYGADVNLTSEKGLNALKIAKQHKRKELVKLFLAFGAEEDINNSE